MPNLRSLPPGATTVPFTVRDGYVGLDEYTDLTHRQQFRSRHLHRRADGAFDETWLPFRFVWPAELDFDGPHSRHDARGLLVRVDPRSVRQREHLRRQRLARP